MHKHHLYGAIGQIVCNSGYHPNCVHATWHSLAESKLLRAWTVHGGGPGRANWILGTRKPIQDLPSAPHLHADRFLHSERHGCSHDKIYETVEAAQWPKRERDRKAALEVRNLWPASFNSIQGAGIARDWAVSYIPVAQGRLRLRSLQERYLSARGTSKNRGLRILGSKIFLAIDSSDWGARDWGRKANLNIGGDSTKLDDSEW